MCLKTSARRTAVSGNVLSQMKISQEHPYQSGTRQETEGAGDSKGSFCRCQGRLQTATQAAATGVTDTSHPHTELRGDSNLLGQGWPWLSFP